jgi:hypothetical protein
MQTYQIKQSRVFLALGHWVTMETERPELQIAEILSQWHDNVKLVTYVLCYIRFRGHKYVSLGSKKNYFPSSSPFNSPE